MKIDRESISAFSASAAATASCAELPAAAGAVGVPACASVSNMRSCQTHVNSVGVGSAYLRFVGGCLGLHGAEFVAEFVDRLHREFMP